MAEIKLVNIKKEYESKKLLEDFSLTVNDGEFVCLLGPTGSGKSAVLRLIAGLDEITSGELLIDGELSNQKIPKDRNAAMVFANEQLMPQNVYENIAFGLKLRKLNAEEINIKVREIARILNIEGILQKKPKTLTAHERQRVTIARRLVREPSVCLFDDVLSSLNDDLTKIMRSELVKIHYRLGSTFIFATRDQIDAMTMATKIVVLNGGKIEQIGSPREIYTKPQTVFVATYVGSPQINLATGVLNLNGDNASVEFCGMNLEINKDSLVENLSDKQNLTVAIRPENIKLSKNGNFEAEIKSVENHGAYKVLTLQLGEKTLNEWSVITTGDEEIKVGDKLGFEIDVNKLHLFDQMSEQTILK